MLLAVYRRLYVPLNGVAALLLLAAGLLAWMVPTEVGASRAEGVVVAAAAVVPVLAVFLRRRSTSGLALAVGIVALLTAAASFGALGAGLVRVPALIACGCLGGLVVLCTLVRADDQSSSRDSVVR